MKKKQHTNINEISNGARNGSSISAQFKNSIQSSIAFLNTSDYVQGRPQIQSLALVHYYTIVLF